MSEIALTVLKVLYLALIWLFIMSAVSVIRSDLFGRKVPATEPEARELENPAPPRKSRRQRGTPRLVSIAQGAQAGQSGDLSDGMVMIGRGADCHLILDDDYVSTRHARVVNGNEGTYVEDLGSTNGTYVNGQRITAPTTVTLSDTIRIGKTILKLEP
jgi:hypothetical protein